MNKNLFRVIFSKARGLLVVVAESGPTHRDDTNAPAGELLVPAYAATLKPLSLCLLTALSLLALVNPAVADIIADPNAPQNQQPTVLNAGNGVPVVNIQTPSAAGVSRNTYTNFDVDAKGVIINNSRGNIQTQQGGWVQGNPWLATGTARVILNEVNSSNPSHLNGYIEIAGEKAELVIANPAGIACDGCGFINASRTTLSTGRAEMQNGQIAGFAQADGTIRIEGRGMDSSHTDYTELLARSVEVNAGLWANDLNVTAGAKNGDSAPAVAIDVAQLGGMYAGKITLTSNAAGVGVRNAGQIGASAGDVILTADGRLENSGQITAASTLQITGQSEIRNSGTLYSERSLSIGSTGALDSSGTIASKGDITLNAGAVSNSGKLTGDQSVRVRAETDLNNSGSLSALTGITLDAGRELDNQGVVATAGQIQLTAAQRLANEGQIQSAAALQLRAANIENSGKLISEQTLTAHADGVLDNRGLMLSQADNRVYAATELRNSGQISSVTTLQLDSQGNLSNSGTLSAQSLTVKAALDLDNKGVVVSDSSVTLSSGQRLNNEGQIQSAAALQLSSGTDLSNSGKLLSEDSVTVNSRGKLDNAGLMVAQGNVSLQSAAELNNAGQLSSDAAVQIQSGAALSNSGVVSAVAALTINASTSLDNQGTLVTQDNAHLNVGEQLRNSGTIASSDALQIDAKAGIKNSGTLHAQSALTANTLGNIENEGVMVAAGDNTLNASGASSQVISTQGSLFGAGIKADGTRAAQGSLTISASNAITTHGQNIAGDGVAIVARTLDLQNSTTEARSIAFSASEGDIALNGAEISASQRLHIQTPASLITDGAKLSAETLLLNASRLSNVQGELLQTGNAALTLTTSLGVDNRGGRIASNAETMRIDTSALDNSAGGRIEHAGAGELAINAQRISGQDGQILAANALTLQADSADLSRGLTEAGKLTLTLRELLNIGGDIIHTGSVPASITVHETLDNRAGFIASNSATTLQAGNLDNRGGVLQTGNAAALTINVAQSLNNAEQGEIVAGDALTINAASLENAGGQISATKAAQIQIAQTLNNAQGLIAAEQHLQLTAGLLNNASGHIGSVSDNVTLQSADILNNTQGLIQAAKAISVSSAGLNNHSGTIEAGELRLDSQGQLFNNQLGKLLASGTLILESGELNNDTGLVQATGDLSINTHGAQLRNNNSGDTGGILGQAGITLNTGTLDNKTGFIGANGLLAINAAEVDNRNAGELVSQNSLNVNAGAFNNQGGQIQALKDVTLDLGAAHFDNSGEQGAGLLRAGGTATIRAATINNQNTQTGNFGIEGGALHIYADTVNNKLGVMRADSELTVHSSGLLDNSQGLLSSTGILAVTDSASTKRLQVNNSGGTLIAKDRLSIDSAALSSDGHILSHGDLNIKLVQDYVHSGELIGNGHVSLLTEGAIINKAKLLGGQSLTLNAARIDNEANAEISAAVTTVKAAGQLNNRGLIDGSITHLDAAALTNIGTGRIYGDHIQLRADTLLNAEETVDGKLSSATIAARERLDIGIKTLLNKNDAIIFSMGNMAIAGALDANGQAIGQANTVANLGANIEAMADLGITTTELYNRNTGFVPVLKTVENSKHIIEFGTASDIKNKITTRYDQSVVTMVDHNALAIYTDATKAQRLFNRDVEDYTKFDYKVSILETFVTASAPGKILAGGAMTLRGDRLMNDKSQIIAGGVLAGTLDNLQTIDAQGQRITRVSDGKSQTHKVGFNSWNKKESQLGPEVDYAPADHVTTFNLGISKRLDNTAVTLTGSRPVEETIGSTSARVDGATNAAVALNNAQTVSGITEIIATARTEATGIASVVRTTLPMTVGALPGTTLPDGTVVAVDAPSLSFPPLSVPNNSLFLVNTSNSNRPLIETDERFTQYRQWLSSDYLLGALNIDPAGIQQRLGDGFYEQRLIREQIAELTGHRFLEGFSDEEAQYRSLFDNAVTLAATLKLLPGVALTPQQMAQLTSDIVWLVERDVTLADGTTRKALVPQLYVTLKDGDLRGDGTLLAGESVNIRLSGDLHNSGTIAGRSVLAISAENVQNIGGRIQAADAYVQARNDLNNLGAYIRGENSLTVQAGRDLTVASTTQSDTNLVGASSFSRTNFDRLAGLYVTAPDASLVVSAGRDLTLQAAEIKNSGANGVTALIAGNKLDLTTVKTHEQNNIVFDSANHLKMGHAEEIGTQISAAGDIRLQAGQDLTARAAQIRSSDGAVVATAKNNLSLTAGEASTNLDVASYDRDKGTFSETTTSSSLVHNQTQLLGTNISGQSVSLQAGQDLTLQAAQIQAEQAARLLAGRDIHIGSAEQFIEHAESSSKLRKDTALGTATGLANGGMTGLQRSSQRSQDRQTQTEAIGSQISAGSVAMRSGRDLTIAGSTVVADEQIAMHAGRDLTITTSASTDTAQNSSVSKRSGQIGEAWNHAWGSDKEQQSSDSTTTRQTGSQIASLQGNIALTADGQYQLTGSQVLALEGDIAITAKDVVIDSAYETARGTQNSSTERTALGGSIPLLEQARGAYQMARNTRETSDKRMQALAAATAAMQAVQVYQQAAATATQGLKVSVAVSHSESQSQGTQSGSNAVGSTVQAGGDVQIRAAGAGKDSDITVEGSSIKAGNNATLHAEGDIHLLAAENTAEQHSTNSNSGWSAGIGFAVGGQTGFTIDLAANKGRGKADGKDSLWSNSHIDAGQQLTLRSGGDTTLKGAVITGDKVVADVGGDLHIESLQDVSTYDSKQTSSGGGVSLCIPPICGGASTAYAYGSKQQINSNYASVTEQSGIKAGDGGFDIKVRGNTDLIGGVIASREAAVEGGKNRFETGSLSLRDIENRASYDAEAMSATVSSSYTSEENRNNAGRPEGAFHTESAQASGAARTASGGFASESGQASSTTRSGISGIAGNTDVRSDDKETGIAPIADTERLERELGLHAQITQAFGQAAPKAVADFAESQINDLLTQAKNETDPDRQMALILEAKKWAEGGVYRVMMHATIGGLLGDVRGAVAGATVATAAPQLNDLQQSLSRALISVGMDEDLAGATGQLVMQGTAAGIGAAVSGGNTAGAMAAFNIDSNNRQLHPDEVRWLKEHAEKFAEEQNITVEEAERRLAVQAVRQVDLSWDLKFGEGHDEAAQQYLADPQASFINEHDEQQQLFTVIDNQRARYSLYSQEAVLYQDFITKNLMPAVVMTVEEGAAQRLEADIKRLRDNPSEEAKKLLASAENALAGLKESIKNCATAPIDCGAAAWEDTKRSFVNSGRVIAESSANALDENSQRQLNQIYGQDMSDVNAVMLAYESISAVAGGGGKAVGAVADAAEAGVKNAGRRIARNGDGHNDKEPIKGGGDTTHSSDNLDGEHHEQDGPKDDKKPPVTDERVTIKDHYEHHRDMVNDIKDQLTGQGYRVSDKEISFGSSCDVGRCRPDIVAESPDGKLIIIEIKTGNSNLSIRQSEIFPQIENGDSIPVGNVAKSFGLIPGVPLKEQGYPNGIPIEVKTFPGAKK